MPDFHLNTHLKSKPSCLEVEVKLLEEFLGCQRKILQTAILNPHVP